MLLAELEQFFWRTVRSVSPPDDLAHVFHRGGGLAVERRLGIYHHAYFFRQQQVLGELFPRLREALGESAFMDHARAYIEAQPSRTPVIEQIGRDFPSFLASLDAPVGPVLLDLARFEWARVEALLARDGGAALALSDLAAADLMACRVRVAPSVRLLELRRAALQLFRQQLCDASPDEKAFVVVARRQGTVVDAELEPAWARGLLRSLAGDTLACVFAEFDGPQAVDQATRCLTELLRLELWTGLETNAP